MSWLSDSIHVTGAGELVKSSEITTRVADDGVRRSPTDADDSLGALEWDEPGQGLQGQTTLAQGHPEASAWLA